MRQVLHAEWTKARTLPSTAWTLLGTVTVTVFLGWASAAAALPASDTVKLSLAGVWLGQVTVIVLAVVTMTAEYATGTIGPTLTAVPRRWQVLTAKAVIVTALVLPTAALGVLASLAAGSRAADFAAPDATVARAAFGTVLYFGLVALLALGVGTMLRDGAATITAVLGIVLLLPLLAQLVSDPVWQKWLQRYTPASAGMAVQATTERLPIGPWPGLGVLACYTAAALLAGGILFTVRDA